MLTAKHLFSISKADDKKPISELQTIMAKDLDSKLNPPNFLSDFSDDLKDLFLKMFDIDEKRIYIQGILSHAWMRKNNTISVFAYNGFLKNSQKFHWLQIEDYFKDDEFLISETNFCRWRKSNHEFLDGCAHCYRKEIASGLYFKSLYGDILVSVESNKYWCMVCQKIINVKGKSNIDDHIDTDKHQNSYNKQKLPQEKRQLRKRTIKE